MADRWEDYFDTGETLLWEGRPLPRSGFSLGIFGLAVFGTPFFLAGLAMSGGSLLWMFGIEVGKLQFGEGIFMFFFGLPFLLIGAGIIFGPWYAMRHAHRKVRYALTDKRAYIATSWWGRKIETYPITADNPVSLEDDKTVYFQILTGRDSDGDRTTEEKGFENIADAKEVYHLIRQIQSNQSPDPHDG